MSTELTDGPTLNPTVSGSPGLRAARRWVHIVFSGVLTVIGGLIGRRVGDLYVDAMVGYLSDASGSVSAQLEKPLQDLSVYGMIIIGLGVGFLLASITFRKLIDVLDAVERLPIDDKIAGVVGILLGLGVAYLMSPLVGAVRTYGPPMVAVMYVIGVFGGMLFTFSMKKELAGMFSGGASLEEQLREARALPKLLDTNVIIDGRLLDVYRSGFVEGDLLLPQFVLDELQLLADKADDLIRARGRRGLDLLKKMQEEIDGFRVLTPKDYVGVLEHVDTVDSKLLALAAHMDAALLTNDSNLNRVADVQGVPVLNLNRLAIALKPAFIAGEELKVHIIKPGRDPGQGVAYLDDGTMVVVEDGETKIGRVADVVVTSLLQTLAGKMIFAELKDGGQNRHKGGNGR